jgi:p-cumate 2,3-dioxygenase beta subunit
MNADTITRPEAEAFLIREARLIDEWDLARWAALFDHDGEYLVPSTDNPEGDPATTLFLIYDDRHRLEERAKRLLKRTAHAEFPRSRVRHMISNVEVVEGEEDCQRLLSNFVVYRSRGSGLEVFPGHSVHDVRRTNGEIRIRRKRVMIDTDTLRLQRRISIIL